MQKILYISASNLDKVNSYLEDGWQVVSVTPYFEPVAAGGHSFSGAGNYGAYIVISNEDE